MTDTDDITVVTGQRACRACNYVNEAGNQYCVACGAPIGSVPEIVGDPRRAARTRDTWKVYGVETEVVGRRAELNRLSTLFQNVIDKKELGTAVLVGSPGAGKSRLIHEFSKLTNTRFGDALLISGAWRDSTERENVIVDRILRSRFYIPERVGEDESRRRLLEGIRAIINNPISLEVAHRIGRMLDLPYPNSPYGAADTPDESREASWRALTKLFRADAESNPLVVVLEDMHHASTESLNLVSFLARSLTDVPLMCVISTTPEVFSKYKNVFDGLPRLQRIDVQPLSDDEIRHIVGQVLHQVDHIPERLFDRVCANSMGNPLIAEEILRIFVAEGAIDTGGESSWTVDVAKVTDVDVPKGFSDVAAAGVSRLTNEQRTLLEIAAVVGHTFWPGALRVLRRTKETAANLVFPFDSTRESPAREKLFELLDELTTHDIIRQREESRYPDEYEYTFKHSAVRKMLLEKMSYSAKARIHTHVAQWHELNRDRGIHELDAVIASHHELAGHRERAAIAYRAAAERARDSHLNNQAIKFFKRALKLLDDSQLLARLEVLHDIGGLYDLTGEYIKALPHLKEMLRAAWRLTSLSKGGVAHNKLGRVARAMGQYDEAAQHFDQALHLFRRANDQVGIASTLDDIGKVHWIMGKYSAAEEHYSQSLELRRDIGDKRSLALSLNHLGTVMVAQGAFKEALTHLRESLNLRREIDDKRGVADSLNNLGVIVAERGNSDSALKLWSEALTAAKQIGDRMLEGMIANNIGEVLCNLDQVDEAKRHLTRAEEICNECAEQRLLFDVTRNLGLLALKQEDSITALGKMGRALELAKQLGTKVLEGIALRGLGEVRAHSLLNANEADGRLREAELSFQTSIEILEDFGNESELGRTLLSYGSFLFEQGVFVQARKRLHTAQEIFSRLGMKNLSQRAGELLAEL